MERYIDTVMIGSDRVDERARLIARLCDLLEPLVGDLGPDTRGLLRAALLAAIRQAHDRPLDVVADVLAHLSEAVGACVQWRLADLGPGAGMAVGLCDGRGLTDFALGAATGIDRDEIAGGRDRARGLLGLPPAPPACTRRHPRPGDDAACVPCALARADADAARPRVIDRLGVPDGVVMDRVAHRASRWQEAVRRQGIRRLVTHGPSPWTAMVGMPS